MPAWCSTWVGVWVRSSLRPRGVPARRCLRTDGLRLQSSQAPSSGLPLDSRAGPADHQLADEDLMVLLRSRRRRSATTLRIRLVLPAPLGPTTGSRCGTWFSARARMSSFSGRSPSGSPSSPERTYKPVRVAHRSWRHRTRDRRGCAEGSSRRRVRPAACNVNGRSGLIS